MKAEATVTIHKTPDQVFAYINAAEKFQQWVPVKNVRVLTAGPVGVGSQVSQIVTFLGQNFESVIEVTTYDEPKVFAFKSISGPIPFVQHFTLSPTEEGTKVESIREGDLSGFFKLAQPLLAPMAQKQVQDELNKLKQLIEQ